jgi:hypothetical protein
VDVIEAADHRERNELQSSAGKNQSLASRAIHQPEGEQREQKIDEAHQHRLEECVTGRGSRGAKNFRQEGKQRRDAADLLQSRQHDAEQQRAPERW